MSDPIGREAVINEFRQYLGEVLRLYEDSVPTLKAKLAAITSDDIDGLNRCIQSQQAFVLKTRSFQDKVSDYQARLGISAGSLTDTIRQLPEAHHLGFYSLLGQFEIVLKEFRFHNDKCQALLQSKLYLIDKRLQKMQVRADNKLYRNDARGTQSVSHAKTFETRI